MIFVLIIASKPKKKFILASSSISPISFLTWIIAIDGVDSRLSSICCNIFFLRKASLSLNILREAFSIKEVRGNNKTKNNKL